jgi:hypothetical protein
MAKESLQSKPFPFCLLVIESIAEAVCAEIEPNGHPKE